MIEKIVLVGGTSSLRILLEKLRSFGAVKGVLLQPPDAHECQEEFNKTIKILEQNGIPFLKTSKYSESESYFVKALGADAAYVINCRYLIEDRYLEDVPQGFLVTHGSSLPDLRGFAPLNWSLILGRSELGVTLFKAQRGVDSGPILATRKFTLDATKTISELVAQINDVQIELFLGITGDNDLQAFEQNHDQASYGCARLPMDSFLDFNKTVEQNAKLLKACGPPYPNAFTFWNEKILEIEQWAIACQTEESHYVGIVSGRLVERTRGGSIKVLCAEGGVLEIKTIKFEGKTFPSADIVKSVKATLGFAPGNQLRSLLKISEDLQARLGQLEQKMKAFQ